MHEDAATSSARATPTAGAFPTLNSDDPRTEVGTFGHTPGPASTQSQRERETKERWTEVMIDHSTGGLTERDVRLPPYCPYLVLTLACERAEVTFRSLNVER